MRKKKDFERLQKLRSDLFRGLNASGKLLQAELSQHERDWLEMRRQHITIRLKENNLYKEQVLESEIVALEARIDRMKDFAK